MNLPRKGSFMALTVEKGHNNLKLRTDLFQSVLFVEIKFLKVVFELFFHCDNPLFLYLNNYLSSKSSSQLQQAKNLSYLLFSIERALKVTFPEKFLLRSNAYQI